MNTIKGRRKKELGKYIIPVKEASPELKEFLVKMGILERTENGYKCKEK